MSDPHDHNAMLKPQDWSFPVPIAYGPGRLVEIGVQCAGLGIRAPLVVTDSGSAGLPFVSGLMSILAAAGMKARRFSDISPNPRDTEIAAGRAAFLSGGHDAVIAIGGGRIDIREAPPAEIGPDQLFPHLVTIPTTAGTGAETESTAMITHTGKGMKFCICHPGLKPSLALLDPELTVGLPPHLTAWTGADAMTHAIESYIVPGVHPLCDAMALEGLALISNWLPLAVREPENMLARGGMLVGSCMAGIAFLKGLGMVHAISHMVGAEYDTQHGLTNAIILPVVMRYNLPGLEPKVARMAEVMGISERTADGFTAHLEALLDEIDIPKSLAAIDVPFDCAPRIAEKALLASAAATNPRQAGVADVRQMLETVPENGRN